MPTIACEIKKEAYEILKARVEKEGKSINQYLRSLVYRDLGYGEEKAREVSGQRPGDKAGPGQAKEKEKKRGLLSFWG